jgi:hypothetical protein
MSKVFYPRCPICDVPIEYLPSQTQGGIPCTCIDPKCQEEFREFIGKQEVRITLTFVTKPKKT